MSEPRHVESLREMYRLWALSKGQSVEPWLGLLGDSIRFRSIGGDLPGVEFARDGVSRADVARYFRELSRDWEMLEYQVDELICDGDRVAMLGRCAWRNRHTGKVAESMKADFFRFEDGRIVEFTELFDTARAIAAATQ
ncbi:MAG: nuclear transport factor 2 family protein [Thermodesulfobacteriota bacterium]